MRGYCEICKHEYANIYQHKQTKKHKDTEARINNEPETTNSIQDSDEVITVQDDDVDSKEDSELSPEKTQIQIIDGEPKKEKSTIQEIMDIAFSEQFAPITMSLVTAFAERLQGTHNPERKKGNITYTQAGEEIEDF